MEKELISTCQPVVPSKGSNAGKQMYVINGKYWAKAQPTLADTHVVTEKVEVNGKEYTNVIGYSADIRMTIQDKIALVTKQDAGYSVAIATLLR
jgi:hypothetical protein